MLTLTDTLAGESVRFHYIRTRDDAQRLRMFVHAHSALAIDTESTGLDCYVPDWQLRTVQIGDANDSYVIPAKFRNLIAWLMKQDIKWIGHNGYHDIRCIDRFLGFDTGVVCVGETHIPSHHHDSRNQQEGGVGHGLKELAIAHIDRQAGKWEVALKRVFKTIKVPIVGQVYKSGLCRGQQKMRKIRLAEGWALINPRHPAYIAYAAADPILTYRVWQFFQPTVKRQLDLYHFDLAVAGACDALQRRGLKLDVTYTERLSAAYTRTAEQAIQEAATYGCSNIQSGKQVADTLLDLGAHLTVKTPSGNAFKTDDKVLRRIMTITNHPGVREFIHCVLLAKQLLKRRESYTEAMLRGRDTDDRVHASINPLGARTARMSVSRPPFQQLPTKNREGDE